MRTKCHLCDGTGQVYEMEGWAAPAWQECYACRGTGHPSADLACGCVGIPALNLITGYACRKHWADYPNARIGDQATAVKPVPAPSRPLERLCVVLLALLVVALLGLAAVLAR